VSGYHPAYPETQQILCALERLIKGEDLNGRVPRHARASLVHASVLRSRVPLDQWNGIPLRAATRNQIANALVERRTQAQDVEAMDCASSRENSTSLLRRNPSTSTS
jgi:hypothetical protein